MANKNVLFLIIGLLLFAGCASQATNASYQAERKRVQRPPMPAYRPPAIEEGSLWSEERGISLFSDIRARRVGDTVTVRIVEDPEAKLDANTKTSRTSSLNGKLKFLGYMQALADKNMRLAQNPGEDDLIKSTLNTSFDGKGTSDREGHINAYITARVVNVLPNGNLYINGMREIKVNNELQYITLAGIIRPVDISTSNEIVSTYIADARITYSGVGVVADKQHPGWLTRVMDYVWPF